VDDITLPPLPPAEWLGYDDPERGDFHGHSFDAMCEFARAAVMLDRQRRRKPSAGFLAALMEWSPPGTVRVFGDSQGNRFEIEVRKRRGVPAEGMGLEAIGREPK
jgi:hypothetical protein